MKWPLVSAFCVVSSMLSAAELPRCIEPDPHTGTSAAVVIGDRPLMHTKQIMLEEAATNSPADDQIKDVLERLNAILSANGSGLEQVAKLNFYVAKPDVTEQIRSALAHLFSGGHKPAVSFVVTRLPNPAAQVAVDAVATTDLDPGRAVQSHPDFSVAPNGTRIYVAGQAEPAETLAEATRQTLGSLRETLKFLGRGDRDVLQLKAFLTPMSEAAVVQQEIATFFAPQSPPPTVLVEWKSAATSPIEIELIAWGGKNESGEAVEYLTPPGLQASPVYSRVARINHSQTIYVSSLYGSANSPHDTETASQGEREVAQVFSQLERVLTQAGSDLRHLVKATYYVATDDASRKLNELRPRYYDPARPPSASKALVEQVGRAGGGLTMDMIAVPAYSDENPEYGPPEFGATLSAHDAADGWISLFDGQTTLGWRDATASEGALAGGGTTSRLGDCEVRADFAHGGTVTIGNRELQVPAGALAMSATGEGASAIELGPDVSLRSLVVRPRNLSSLFNGRDMTDWKRIDHPQVREESRPTWSVAEESLRARGGPGCVEYQGGLWGDLVLQLDVRTNVRHANGGVFFRAIPGDFMNGYEAQVFNRGEDSDPARPATWSTGAIDDRQNARRVVSRDKQFYRMTVIAQGNHLATWINGYQQVDWTDERAPHANARVGRRVEPGALQLQAHDHGTDVTFRNIVATRW